MFSLNPKTAIYTVPPPQKNREHAHTKMAPPPVYQTISKNIHIEILKWIPYDISKKTSKTFIPISHKDKLYMIMKKV